MFRLNRSCSCGALNVQYTLTGTAVAGTDYTLLSGSAQFADGYTWVNIPIDPNVFRRQKRHS